MKKIILFFVLLFSFLNSTYAVEELQERLTFSDWSYADLVSDYNWTGNFALNYYENSILVSTNNLTSGTISWITWVNTFNYPVSTNKLAILITYEKSWISYSFIVWKTLWSNNFYIYWGNGISNVTWFEFQTSGDSFKFARSYITWTPQISRNFIPAGSTQLWADDPYTWSFSNFDTIWFDAWPHITLFNNAPVIPWVVLWVSLWSPLPTPTGVWYSIYSIYDVTTWNPLIWDLSFDISYMSWSTVISTSRTDTYDFWFDYTQRIEYPYHQQAWDYFATPIFNYNWEEINLEEENWIWFAYTTTVAEVTYVPWEAEELQNLCQSNAEQSAFTWITNFFSCVWDTIKYYFSKIWDLIWYLKDFVTSISSLGDVSDYNTISFNLIPSANATSTGDLIDAMFVDPAEEDSFYKSLFDFLKAWALWLIFLAVLLMLILSFRK